MKLKLSICVMIIAGLFSGCAITEMKVEPKVEIKAEASPITYPFLTRSPFFTIGSHGAPMCWRIGMNTIFGSTAVMTASASVDFLECGGWIPPLKDNKPISSPLVAIDIVLTLINILL